MLYSSGKIVAVTAAICLLGVASCEPKTHETDGGHATIPDGVATGGTCGTIAGLVCASANDYCAMPVGSCQIADMAGTCTTKPDVILAIFQPVCGCDGSTYSNSGAAAAAGINVLAQGECISPL